MALNLDNNFKVSARKQHELPGNQRVLSQRIGHKTTFESPPKLETIPPILSRRMGKEDGTYNEIE